MNAKRFLGFLIPAFIASLIYGYVQMPNQDRVKANNDNIPKTKFKDRKTDKSVTGEVGTFPKLRRDLLEVKPQPYSGVRRNLFASSYFVEPNENISITLPEVLPDPPAPEVVIPVAPPPPPPPTAQEIARQELSKYKFVGFFKKGDKQTIFLSSAGDILLLRKGDYISRDHKYLVTNITDTTLMLHKDGAGDFSIKLNEQESLSAVSLPSATMAPAQRRISPAPEEPESQEPAELQPVPEDEPQTGEQLQPEED